MPKTLLRWSLLVLIVLFVALKGAAAFRTEAHWDAGYYLDISLNYIDNGQLNPSVWRIPPDENILTSGGGGYGTLLLPLWFQAVGFSVTAGRVLMLLAGYLSLAALIWTANRWWGVDAALWTGAFAAAGVMFFHNYTVRMDALSGLVYTLVLALHVYAVAGKRRGLHFVVGVLAIATTEFHIIGLAVAGGLALYMGVGQLQLWRETRRVFASEGFWEYLAGATLAGIVYIFVHILPNPEAYFLIPQLCAICTPAGPLKEMQQVIAWGLFAPIEFGLFLFAIYYLLRNNPAPYAHYLWILLGFVIGYAIVSPPVEFTYLGHRWFLTALGLGAFFSLLTRKAPRVGPVIGLALLVLLGGTRTYETITRDLRYRTYPLNTERVAYIQENLPTEAALLAPPPYFRALIDYRDFATIHRDALYTITLQGIDHDAYLEQVRPAAIIFEERQLLSDEMIAAVERYRTANAFVEVVPDLWVAPRYAEGQPVSSNAP